MGALPLLALSLGSGESAVNKKDGDWSLEEPTLNRLGVSSSRKPSLISPVESLVLA